MDDGIAIALGRLEKSTDTVAQKVDKVSDQMGELGLKVAELGVKTKRNEQDISEIKKDMDEATREASRRGFGVREKLGVAVVTLLGSGLVSWLITSLTDKA